MPVVESVPSGLTAVDPGVWWVAGLVLAILVVLGAVGEGMLLQRLAGDQRPVHLQQRTRRSARWLVALGGLALAQASAAVVALAGVDWAGRPGRTAWAVLAVAAVVSVVAFGYVLRHPVRTRTPLPSTPGQLAPALLGAAAQEVLFRGAVLAWLVAGGVPPLVAVAVSAVAFGATRLSRGRDAAITATLTGAVLGAAVILTGWVAVAVAGHVALLLVVSALGARGIRVPAAAAAGSAVGCGGHDPDSPVCAGCPLAAAAPRRSSAAPAAG